MSDNKSQGFSLKDVFLFVIFVGLFGTVLFNLVGGISEGFKSGDWKPFLKNIVEPTIASDKSLYEVQSKLDSGKEYDLVEKTALQNSRLISFFTFFGVALILFWVMDFLFVMVSDGEHNYFLSIIITLVVLASAEFVYTRIVYGTFSIPLLGLFAFFKSTIFGILRFFGWG